MRTREAWEELRLGLAPPLRVRRRPASTPTTTAAAAAPPPPEGSAGGGARPGLVRGESSSAAAGGRSLKPAGMASVASGRLGQRRGALASRGAPFKEGALQAAAPLKEREPSVGATPRAGATPRLAAEGAAGGTPRIAPRGAEGGISSTPRTVSPSLERSDTGGVGAAEAASESDVLATPPSGGVQGVVEVRLQAERRALVAIEDRPSPPIAPRHCMQAFLGDKLGSLTSREPEYYNENGPLGDAIQEAVALASILDGWPKGLVQVRVCVCACLHAPERHGWALRVTPHGRLCPPVPGPARPCPTLPAHARARITPPSATGAPTSTGDH